MQERREHDLWTIQSMVDGLHLASTEPSAICMSTTTLTGSSTIGPACGDLNPAADNHQQLSSVTTSTAALSSNAAAALQLQDLASAPLSMVQQQSPSESSPRSFIRYDLVTMTGSLGAKKDRATFLFTDLLVICSLKRRSSASRKPD